MTSDQSAQEPPSWHIMHAYNNAHVGNPDAAFVLQGIETLSEEGVAALQADRKSILGYGACLHLVQAVETNIEDFYDAVDDCVQYISQSFNHLTEEVVNEMSLNLSRLMVNISAMFRAFLDHSDTYISRTFGQHSDEYKAWKGCLSRQYDHSFAYRFFYYLRNYIQHVDMPPLSLSFSAAAESSTISIRVALSRDDLLIDKAKWKNVASELGRQPAQIPVLEIINEWQQCFAAISDTRLRISADKALAASQRVLRIRERVAKPYGRLCIGLIPAGPMPREHLNFDLDWLPETMAKLVVDRASRNAST